ncbi:MAG: RHS repeat-associated core domain-containing protein [Anaerolineae bacterium]|nr:RHS repeat-associated core domain-containing protein [Anaerolineae bacterium]
MYDYHARYYHPALGRFVSADTIVPNPSDPQSLNRYAYTLNNPLKYTDPSGYLSEEQIRGYFGVETWEEVLKFYQGGGEFQGKWGWLETLRAAEIGDTIDFIGDYGGGYARGKAEFSSRLVDLHGGLYLKFPGSTFQALFPAISNGFCHTGIAAYGVKRDVGEVSTIVRGPIFADKMYQHFDGIDFSAIDWVGAAFDIGGLVADALTAGVGGRFVEGAQRAGTITDLAGLAWDWGPAAIAYTQDELSSGAVMGLGVDVFGMAAQTPFVWDTASLVLNVSQAIRWTP